MGLLDQFKQLDAHPKALEEFRVRTGHGGAVSLVTLLLSFLLLLSQINQHLAGNVEEELIVDSTLHEQLPIRFNLTFPGAPCRLIGLDVFDAAGGHPQIVEDEVYKVDLDAQGRPLQKIGRRQTISSEAETIHKEDDFDKHAAAVKDKHTEECGSCYGAGRDGECCATCRDVRIAYARKRWELVLSESMVQCKSEFEAQQQHALEKGCLVYGRLHVPKAGGSFHIAPANSLKHAHTLFEQLLQFTQRELNATHRIDYLQFGDDDDSIRSPLTSRVGLVKNAADSGVFQYFIKIVPTDVFSADGLSVVHTNQYSATEHFRPLHLGGVLPGVFFHYELSPIRMVVKRTRPHLAHFLTNICATIGGVYTAMKVVDHVIHTHGHMQRGLIGNGRGDPFR